MVSNIEFQIISWHSGDETLDPKKEDEDDNYKSYYKATSDRFVITILVKIWIIKPILLK